MIMDLVKKIEEKLGIKATTEVTDSKFLMFDDGGIEISTGQLLHGFIKRLKPTQILETGLYSAISTIFMADAVRENGFGNIDTIELDEFHIKKSQDRLNKMELQQFVTIYHSKSLDFQLDKQYQFMFLDTELNLRFHELVKFFPYLDEGGYIFVHDMPNTFCVGNINTDHLGYVNWPVGEIPPGLNDLLREDKLRLFHFGSARGLAGFYKPTKDDYKWK